MLIGDGFIANNFIEYKDNDSIIIFASGVSNSVEKNEKNFKREKDLLLNTLEINKNRKIVYFFSFVDNDKGKKYYAKHKDEMTNIIKSSGNDYLIIRFSQIIGHSRNPTTLFNYLKFNIINNSTINVYEDCEKGLIDIDDVLKITNYLININQPKKYIEFPYIEKKLVIDIVNLISTKLDKKPSIKIIKHPKYTLPLLSIDSKNILGELNIKENNYIKTLIDKYV